MELGNSYLERCEAAGRGGFPLLCEVGDLIGRGFADVGYEVFAVLPGDRLISVLTGEQTSFQEADTRHYFSVPEVDSIIQVLESSGDKVLSVERRDAREWHVQVETQEGQISDHADENLSLCLLSFFIEE